MSEQVNVIDVSGDSEDSEGPSQPKKSRSTFTIKRKLEVIEFKRKNSWKQTCQQFKVSMSNVQNWIKQEKQLRELLDNSSKSNLRKRLDGGGRPLHNKDFDEKLLEWIQQKREEKHRVSRRMIQQQAIKLSEEECDEEVTFKASSGWLEKFLKRHNLSNRRPTTVCQKPPMEYADKIIKFVLYVRHLCSTKQFHHIYAADETALWLDCGGSTVERTGAKEVSVLTTGHDKIRVTVMLTARADGYKCQPFVLLNRKRPIPAIVNAYKNQLHLIWSGKTWMDDDFTTKYLMMVFGQGHLFRRLLVWDSFRCHLSDSTKKTLKKIRLDTAVVPGGCTKFVQPPDVVWNAPFKASFRRRYEDWMLHGEKEVTAGGNPRPPPMMDYLGWLVKAWEELPETTIAESFKVCGITNAADGTENERIHCFKPEGPIPNGIQMLRNAEAEQIVNDLNVQFEEIDLLQDEENDLLSDGSLEF